MCLTLGAVEVLELLAAGLGVPLEVLLAAGLLRRSVLLRAVCDDFLCSADRILPVVESNIPLQAPWFLRYLPSGQAEKRH